MSSDLRDRVERIRGLALRDAETGLPNRLGLEQHLIEALAARGGGLAVSALHAPNSEALIDAARRLAREDAIVGRLGVNTLALVFAAPSAAAAEAGLADILQRQSRAFSAGLVLGPENAGADCLLNAAEAALARATESGAPVVMLNVPPAPDDQEEAVLLADLAASLGAGDLSLLHQPKVSVADGAVTGVESLVRWAHPRRGVVSPDYFVPIAEARGEIAALTEWTLAQAIADQRALARAGFDLPFAVNISAALLADRAFARRAIDAVAAARLCFEITETAAMTDARVARDIIMDFVAAGVEISIDDYGVRLSSLFYLTHFPAHELKIDKKFVSALGMSAYDEALVAAMIALAHDLGLAATAEGVETAGALAMLRRLGCDRAQGNFIAPPLSLADLGAYLAAR